MGEYETLEMGFAPPPPPALTFAPAPLLPSPRSPPLMHPEAGKPALRQRTGTPPVHRNARPRKPPSTPRVLREEGDERHNNGYDFVGPAPAKKGRIPRKLQPQRKLVPKTRQAPRASKTNSNARASATKRTTGSSSSNDNRDRSFYVIIQENPGMSKCGHFSCIFIMLVVCATVTFLVYAFVLDGFKEHVTRKPTSMSKSITKSTTAAAVPSKKLREREELRSTSKASEMTQKRRSSKAEKKTIIKEENRKTNTIREKETTTKQIKIISMEKTTTEGYNIPTEKEISSKKPKLTAQREVNYTEQENSTGYKGEKTIAAS